MARNERPDPHLETAMDWLLRLQSADAEERRRFDLWLEADPAHRVAWERARGTWALIGKTRPVTAARWRARPPARPLFAPLAAAASIAVAVAGFWLVLLPAISLHVRADHATGTAELRRVTLDDGSVVDLAPRSALAVRYADGARRVDLLAGQAFFEVVHDAARPFVVGAGDVVVTDLGTAFDIRMADDQTVVDVQHGVVRVENATLSPPLDVEMRPGDRLTVDHAARDVLRETADTEAMAGWRTRLLHLRDVTVADALDQVRPFSPAWIVVADADLGARRVTGLYDLSDPDRALRALVQPADGRVRRITPFLYVLSAP